MLLCLHRVIEGDHANNITKMNLGVVTNEGRLTPHQMRDQFMAFGIYDASVLQKKMNDVTNKLQVFHVLHMQDIHCVAH
jgi:hypothetical protein